MNINKRILIILIIILALAVSGCNRDIRDSPTLIVEDYNGVDIDNVHHYRIEVDLDPDSKSYEAKQKVEYINFSIEKLDYIYFHLYPNAYKSLETAPILFDESLFTQEDFEPGYMELKDILVDNKPVNFQIEGIDDTILKIHLPSPTKTQ